MAARLTAYVVVAIVAATLIAGLIVGAQREDSDGPVDLIVRNGNVYTADRRGTVAEAVAIRGNQILRVGTDREIARLQRPQTIVVDAEGGAVFPGFNDAHVDLIDGGLRLGMADLEGAGTGAEVLERIRAWSTANPGAGWVIGSGWSPDQFKNGMPTRQMLDAIVKDRPALIYAADESDRLVWVNSRALRLANITRKTPEPADGAIVREKRGEPSGVLRGSVASGVAALVPAPGRDERAQALRAAIAEANLRGITSAQNTASSCERNLDLFDEARRSGEMTLRVYCSVAADPHGISKEADLAPYDEIRKRYPDDPIFKVGALSFTVDGTLPARSAALLEPYADAPEESGEVLVDPDELNRAVRLADAAGWQVVTHATGDRAVRLALTAYAHAIRSNRPPARGRRHRLEHLALVDAADVSRFGPLGVTASMQPSMMAGDETAFELLSKTIGADRAAGSFPLGSLAAGTRMLLGSAWPAHTLDPLAVLERAIAGSSPGAAERGEPATPATPDALKLKPAIEAYTSSGAWGSFDDQRKGSIAPGMLADLVVLSADVLAAPETLDTASVAVTVFDGKIVHRAKHALTAPAPSLQH